MFIKCLLFVSNISKNSQNFTYFPFFTVYIYMLIYAENVFPNKCWYWKNQKALHKKHNTIKGTISFRIFTQYLYNAEYLHNEEHS